MAKRFTDTTKWDRAWFRKLTPKMKCAWIYLCDKCDHAGVWTIDIDALSFHVGEEITELELKQSIGDKLVWLDAEKIFISAFTEFQYGALNPDNRVHKSVIERLTKLNVLKDLIKKNKPLISPLQGAKDKEQEKDKGNKGGVGENFEDKQNKVSSVENFDARFSKEGLEISKIIRDYPLDAKFGQQLKDILNSFGTSENFISWVRDLEIDHKNKKIEKSCSGYISGVLFRRLNPKGEAIA